MDRLTLRIDRVCRIRFTASIAGCLLFTVSAAAAECQRDCFIKFEFASFAISLGEVGFRKERTRGFEISLAKPAHGGFDMIIERVAQLFCGSCELRRWIVQAV